MHLRGPFLDIFQIMLFLSKDKNLTYKTQGVNNIANALRCVRSADQNMAAHNRPLEIELTDLKKSEAYSMYYFKLHQLTCPPTWPSLSRPRSVCDQAEVPHGFSVLRFVVKFTVLSLLWMNFLIFQGRSLCLKFKGKIQY